MIDKNYKRATKLLQEHMPILHAMTDALMKYETIDTKQIDDLMAGKTVRAPQNWTNNLKKPDSPDKPKKVTRRVTKKKTQADMQASDSDGESVIS